MIPIWLFTTVCWIFCSVICGIKQYQVGKNYVIRSEIEQNEMCIALAIMLGPIWLVGAFINQVLVKHWQ